MNINNIPHRRCSENENMNIDIPYRRCFEKETVTVDTVYENENENANIEARSYRRCFEDKQIQNNNDIDIS